MDILAHIKTLLYDYDCVIIPGFGGLLTNRHEAKILSYKNTITPPSKSVAFNEQLKVNDGLLISFISSEEELSRTEATEKVKNFVASLFDEIEEKGVIILSGIGNFSFNEENNLVFEPDNKANFLEESYGLTEVPIIQIENDNIDMKQPPRRPRPAVGRPPVRKVPKPEKPEASSPDSTKSESPKKEKPASSSKPANKKPIFILLPIVLLVAAVAISYFGKDKQGNPYLSALIPSLKVEKEDPKVEEAPAIGYNEEDEVTSSTETEEEASAPTTTTEAAAPAATETVEEAAPAPAPVEEKKSVPGTISTSTGRFHIVAGSFRNVSNAEGFESSMKGKSSNVKLLPPGGSSTLYKVSVAQYESMDAAMGDIEGLRATYGNEIWIYEE